jgi:hypothetical protein
MHAYVFLEIPGQDSGTACRTGPHQQAVLCTGSLAAHRLHRRHQETRGRRQQHGGTSCGGRRRAILQRVRHLTAVRSDFEATRKTLVQWLQDLDLHLKSLASNTGSTDSRIKLRNLKVLFEHYLSEVYNNESLMQRRGT